MKTVLFFDSSCKRFRANTYHAVCTIPISIEQQSKKGPTKCGYNFTNSAKKVSTKGHFG